MKIVLAGTFGRLGTDVLKALVKSNPYEVATALLVLKEIPEIEGKHIKKIIDVTKPKARVGLCAQADAVISTVGFTTGSATITNYDIDYQGNLNLLEEAKKADSAPDVPMLDEKAIFEKNSNLVV